jgi:hypothetical protein
MEVIQAKQEPVRYPIPSSEDSPHARQQQSSKQQFFSQHRVEHCARHKQRQHSPVADQLRPGIWRIEEGTEVEAGWLGEKGKDRNPELCSRFL